MRQDFRSPVLVAPRDQWTVPRTSVVSSLPISSAGCVTVSFTVKQQAHGRGPLNSTHRTSMPPSPLSKDSSFHPTTSRLHICLLDVISDRQNLALLMAPLLLEFPCTMAPSSQHRNQALTAGPWTTWPILPFAFFSFPSSNLTHSNLLSVFSI